MSCLELVIVSEELFEYVEELFIDKQQIFTPHRPIGKGKLCFTDHFSIILKFRNIPMKRIGKCFAPKTTMWNMKRENGWENYKKMTDDNQELVELLENEEMDSSELAKKVESVVTKIKFKAFGKVTVSNNGKEDKILENLYVKRKHLLDNALNMKKN